MPRHKNRARRTHGRIWGAPMRRKIDAWQDSRSGASTAGGNSLRKFVANMRMTPAACSVVAAPRPGANMRRKPPEG